MRHAHLFGAIAWIAVSFASLAALAKYKSIPGHQGVSREMWPAKTAISRGLDRPTLVLFLHPRCPCARATVEELIAILSLAQTPAKVDVAFFLPDEESEAWGRTDISRTVADLPGVAFHWDRGGREARGFGASTSGHAFLYNPAGRLRFSGGITASRGHVGDNPGRRAVIDLLLAKTPETSAFPVFGCPILDDPLE